MATERDVVAGLFDLSQHAAKQQDEAPTGVKPGFSAALGGTVLPNGKLRYVASGGLLLAVYDRATNLTRGAGTTARIDFDSPVYDPSGLVTVGASWKFVPPAPGWYGFKIHSTIEPSAALNAGENLGWFLWPDGSGTFIQTMAWLEIGVNEASQRTQIVLESFIERECATTDAINFRFQNGTANSVVLVGDTSEPGANRISIVRLA